ncbi:MAG: hypothetical protein FWD97_01110 [Defluviitaleaceae bacterium]|nr:hypothetical protein [Defluviitaleaceae bacterium]
MKKDEFRFTIRFCKVSPKHVTAMRVLNAAGRQKASLIADLIDEYIKKRGADAFARHFCETVTLPDQSGGDNTNIEIDSSKASKSSVAKLSDVTEISVDYLADSTEDEPMSDEVQNSILEALDMFKMKT